MGLVSKSSSVPIFFSSLKARIVTAGMRNSSTKGANSKKAARSANPASNMLYSPPKTQRNNPLITKNTAITKYPMGPAKKLFISFCMIAFIGAYNPGASIQLLMIKDHKQSLSYLGLCINFIIRHGSRFDPTIQYLKSKIEHLPNPHSRPGL